MASRLLAFVVAVAMVLGAVAVRARINDGDSKSGSAGRSGPLELVCATELRQVCDAIDAGASGLSVTVEPAAVTADRLESTELKDAAIDGWLAPGPWGELVDAARPSDTGKLFADSGAPLARSPFVLAVWKDKRAKLACPDPVDLGCVGDAVNTREFKLGVAADDQAEGVLADAALGAGHIKNPNFATNDLTETDLSDWLAGVDTNADRVARNPGGRSFAEMLTFGFAVAEGYLSTEAVIGPQLARAAKRSQLDLVYVVPAATADVLFAPRTGDRGTRLRDVVRGERALEALRANGWRVPGRPAVAGINPNALKLAADDGLPSAGVLQALRDVTK
ncbi:MAG: substrate-binding domain-containing protein [Actinobacteria bacterium]|nr:substrate-binding domain-containing protein [Actinomycetota bacterium]